MPCDRCQHTMHNLGLEQERKFWCPRCGLVKSIDANGFETVSVPMLVTRILVAEATSICTLLASGQPVYAVPVKMWVDVCASVGIEAHEPSWLTAGR